MTPTLHSLSVRRASGTADWPAATSLLLEYVQWIRTATSFDPLVEQPSFADELDDLAQHYSSRNSVLFLACLGEQAVGTLGVVVHPDRCAELKRMYVRPSARGIGIADALLADAISMAAHRQCSHIRLETVRGAMDAAISVYRRNGFRIVDDGTPTVDVAGVVVMRRGVRSRRSGATASRPRSHRPTEHRPVDRHVLIDHA